MVTKNDNVNIYLQDAYGKYYGELDGYEKNLSRTMRDVTDSFLLYHVPWEIENPKKMRTVDHEGIDHEWVPVYFTFRAPSEHTFDGKHMDLELQFLHRNILKNDFQEIIDPSKTRIDDSIMILSMFFDREAGGEETNQIIENLQFNEASKTEWELTNLKVEEMMKEMWEQEDNDFL